MKFPFFDQLLEFQRDWFLYAYARVRVQLLAAERINEYLYR